MLDLHTLRVTGFRDDDVLFELEHCPRDGSCAVWHECLEGCAPPDQDAEDEGEFDSHGRTHQKIEGSWMIRDEPYNCGAFFISAWFGLEDLAREGGLGVYEFDVDWNGDDWVPVGIEKRKEQKDV